MTMKIQNPVVDDTKSRKRILKPAVEKKRRDRINKSLAELRTMLLNYTADPRLQNPKIEKAEILDLVVDYLQKWTDGKNLSNDATYGQMKTPVLNLHQSESSPPSHLNIESAGFQQCVAQLASYMHKITPAQRTSLIEGLKHHAENQQPSNTSSGQDSSSSSSPSSSATDSSHTIIEMPHATSAAVICTSESKEGSHRSLFLSHSPPQPQSCSTPCHDTLSPPTSPWFSPSFSTYSPPFPSFACHFSFPSCLSPPSSNTSFSTLPQSLHTLPAPVVFSPTVAHFPSLTTLRPPPHPARREGSLTGRTRITLSSILKVENVLYNISTVKCVYVLFLVLNTPPGHLVINLILIWDRKDVRKNEKHPKAERFCSCLSCDQQRAALTQRSRGAE
ncbi:hairy-related 11 [Scomber scombrus]|uniref:Hairy-related 11 n=1 Tax=Scomber scombrus TaxID=13677 RepID=A0AAV1PTK1_SCOSC